jgi:crossover junction endodeoxyribonuclease RuvC
VLGVDPGLIATGYALLENGAGAIEVVDAGVIETASDLPLPARIAAVHDGIATLLEKHAPALVVLEDLYAEYNFPRTAILMAHARGVICLAAHQREVTVLTLAPAEVKRGIAGSGAAAKEQIERSVQRLLGLEAPPRPSHVADALALALMGLSRIGVRIG